MKERSRPHNQSRPGAPRRNRNAVKSPSWVNYPLDSRENVSRFIKDTIRATWIGRLGTRQASAINGATRLLMELEGWIAKSPIILGVPAGRAVEIEQISFEEMLRRGVARLRKDPELAREKGLSNVA